MALALVAMRFTTLVITVTPVVVVGLMENFRVLPLVAFTGNSSEEQSSGKQVESFHLRRV
ncbi:hypothetical protein [Haloferula sp.]|uniref:hypothetical protein n=1 Tax=Haloferula sp. TaxID=2497595 RepID=UPI00329CCD3F